MRTAQLKLLYNNRDISASIAGHVLSVEHEDNAGGQADDLRITLEDRDDLWKNGWYPEKGAELKASFECHEWPVPGRDVVYSAGTFSIDEIESMGPPDTITIKAAASAVTNSLRREKKTRPWDNVTLEQIGRTIVTDSGMQLFYQADEPVQFNRVDQREESDLAFLKRLSEAHGLNCKVAVGKVIIYAEKKFDALPSVLSLSRGDGCLRTWRFSSKSADIYRACQVAYWDVEAKQERIYSFAPEQAPPTGQVLKINERVEGLAAAMERAKTELRKRNKREVEGELTCWGLPEAKAGLNMSVGGFGVFNGKYAMEKLNQKIDKSGGYTCSLSVRKVLEY